jgi:hypothetical protein
MRCTSCGGENPEGAKFCIECAAPFSRHCPSCGSENLPRAKFCAECGSPLTAQPQPPVSSSGFQVSGSHPPVPSTQPLAPDSQSEAETCFKKSIEIARCQSAKSLELRAVMSLSRLWQRQGKKDQARQMLAEIYGWFTEGFDTKDLQEAKALLEALT